ncbi:hypothetical protein PJO47_29175, partial [Mycobacterium kansasii]
SSAAVQDTAAASFGRAAALAACCVFFSEEFLMWGPHQVDPLHPLDSMTQDEIVVFYAMARQKIELTSFFGSTPKMSKGENGRLGLSTFIKVGPT